MLRNFLLYQGVFFDKLYRYSKILILSLYLLDAPVFHHDLNYFQGIPPHLRFLADNFFSLNAIVLKLCHF